MKATRGRYVGGGGVAYKYINKYISIYMYTYIYIYISLKMENHMAKKMANETVIKRFIGIGVSRNKG